jgi:hypothetical protein
MGMRDHGCFASLAGWLEKDGEVLEFGDGDGEVGAGANFLDVFFFCLWEFEGSWL